jgi:predicted esterase
MLYISKQYTGGIKVHDAQHLLSFIGSGCGSHCNLLLALQMRQHHLIFDHALQQKIIRLLHGLGYTTTEWSSLQRNLPSIRPMLGVDMHYIFPPAPAVSITINGGMQMPGWFDLYDWLIGVNARDDRDEKIAAAEQIKQVRSCVC